MSKRSVILSYFTWRNLPCLQRHCFGCRNACLHARDTRQDEESWPPSRWSHLPERRASPSCTNGRAHDPALVPTRWSSRSRPGLRDIWRAALRSTW
eukprot:5371244-Prymnesium_polylepis.1